MKELGRREFCLLLADLSIGFIAAGCNSNNRTAGAPTVKSAYDKYKRPTQKYYPKLTQCFTDDLVNQSVPTLWIPPKALVRPGRWQGIVIHHTATDSGSADWLDGIHKNGNGWDGLGYDFVIDNGCGQTDGKIEVGYRWRQQLTGAHCRPKKCYDNYWNEHTIGVCLVGNFEKTRPTQAQYDSLANLMCFLQNEYNIPMNKIIGHRDAEGAQTLCPGKNFSWWELRRRLQ